MRSRGLLAAIVAAALAAGCGSVQKPAGVSSKAPAHTTFTYDTSTQVMVGWDPSTAYSDEIIAIQNMYEPLTYYNSQTQKLEPVLATSWSRSPDGKMWTFHLRPG